MLTTAKIGEKDMKGRMTDEMIEQVHKGEEQINRLILCKDEKSVGWAEDGRKACLIAVLLKRWHFQRDKECPCRANTSRLSEIKHSAEDGMLTGNQKGLQG